MGGDREVTADPPVRTPRFPSRLLNARFPCNTGIGSQSLVYAKTTIDLLLNYASAPHTHTGVLAGGRDLAKDSTS